jgi:hypothetical protein
MKNSNSYNYINNFIQKNSSTFDLNVKIKGNVGEWPSWLGGKAIG